MTMISRLLALASALIVFFGAALPSAWITTAGPELSALDRRPWDPGPEQAKSWPYKGDRLVREGLVLAAISATGLRPVEVWQGLRDKQSIAVLAASAGKSEAEVLAVFDEMAAYRMDRAVEKGKLPESLAQSRAAWFKEAARYMVEQPRLVPAYPGLHELHSTLIGAAMDVSGLERSQIREELHSCLTLDQILSDDGHSGQEAVQAAMAAINGWMDQLLKDGKLTPAQRESWGDGISAALGRMAATPGLHVAGKACSG
jgi:hypothetical protein